MSFNRLNYDEGAYKQELNQSVGPGVYKLAEPKVSCQSCYPYPPSVRLQKQGNSIDRSRLLIDTDSELMGLNRRLSKNPDKNYVPVCPDKVCTSGEVCGQGVIGSCNLRKPGERYMDNNLQHYKDCFIPSEDTRLSNPACNLRGTGWNRWEWLCKNPQDNIEQPFDSLVSSRTLAKINHRPCIPTPIDQHTVYPDEKKEKKCETIENIKTFCAVPTNPPSVQWQSLDMINKY